jgi:hypothetical protein
MLAYQNLNKIKEKDGPYRLASRVKFVDCCRYLSSIHKFSLAGHTSSEAGCNGLNGGSTTGSGADGSGCNTLAGAAEVIGRGSKGKSSCLLSLIRRSQRGGGVYIAYRCVEGVRERRDLFVRTIRWDVTWRAHSDEGTREELTLVIW